MSGSGATSPSMLNTPSVTISFGSSAAQLSSASRSAAMSACGYTSLWAVLLRWMASMMLAWFSSSERTTVRSSARVEMVASFAAQQDE